MASLNRFLRFFILTLTFEFHLSNAFDLCLLFGVCNNNNNNNNNNRNNFNFNARSDPGPEVTQVDGDWLEPKGSDRNILYHFGTHLGPTDYYDADSYCSNKGGYLAEPSSEEEQNFIVENVRRLSQTNWWIGLRSTEDCQCSGSSPDIRNLEPTKSSFEASIDFDSLIDRSLDLSPVKTTCPDGFVKTCQTPVWRWANSLIKVGYSRWNGRTGEPNSPQENCVALWSDEGFNWSDWTCKTPNAGPIPFKPICQKDKETSDNIGGKRAVQDYQEFVDNRLNQLSEEEIGAEQKTTNIQYQNGPIRCMESNVVYRSHRSEVVNTIVKVDSADLCRSYCAEDQNCRFWTWFGLGWKQKCVLKASLRGSEFRQTKVGSVSGTMLNNCRPEKIPTPETPIYDETLTKIYL